MIITVDEFFNSGIPTSTDIDGQEVDLSIKTVEQYYVRPRIGNEKWEDIAENPTEYEEALNGSNTLSGLKLAMYHLVFAYMLLDKIRLTRYTPTIKDDEHSTEPSLYDVKQIASAHWELGETFVRECLNFLQIEDKGCKNNLLFNELIY